MILISHRGNLTGPVPTEENSISYIEAAFQKGFEVEVDLWRKNNRWYFGHDEPMYRVDQEFLVFHQRYLWFHCKNVEALSGMRNLSILEGRFHYFWHQEDFYALTSSQWAISYPGKPACLPLALCMLPERHLELESIPDYLQDQGFHAVCSDYIENLAELNSQDTE